MLQFGRFGEMYCVIDQGSGVQLQITRQGAKDLARFLMRELGVVKAELHDGTDVFEKDALVAVGETHAEKSVDWLIQAVKKLDSSEFEKVFLEIIGEDEARTVKDLKNEVV